MRCMSHEFWSESSADFNTNWKYLKKAVNGQKDPWNLTRICFRKCSLRLLKFFFVYVFCWNQQKSLKNLGKATIIPIKFVLFGYYFTRKGCSRLKAVSIHIWWRLETTFAYKCYMKVLTSSVADCEEAGTLV